MKIKIWNLLYSFFILTLLPLAAYAQSNIVVDAPNDIYSGTYVYQGTRNSTSTCSGIVQTRAYYRLGATNYYLYADYMNKACYFPNWYYWFICDGLLDSPGSADCIYSGWESTGILGPEDCEYWYDNASTDITSQMSVTLAASGVAPTVSTLPASLVTTTSGTIGGNVVADGGAAVTARGLVYSSSDATPTIGEGGVTHISKGTGTGSFTESVSSLTSGLTYYYQAYGTNTYGTTYGGVKSFTTPTTSQPNKYVSGITTPGGANGVYVWIGTYYGKPAWKHQTSNYWIYYSWYSSAFPDKYDWYIDDELKDAHGTEDFLFDHTDVAACPSSGWVAEDGTGTPAIIDYPQIEFTNGSAFSPGNPTGNTNNNPIGRFYLDADIAGASLTALTINVAGTRTGINNLKLWSSTDATFNSGSDIQLNSQSDGATVTFSGFSSSISASGTYYFITTDLSAAATGTIALTIGSKDNLTYSGGASSTVFTNAALTSGTITIIPAVSISVNDIGINENAGNAVFTITLTQTYGSDITVNYATADNTATTADNDYTNTSGTATIIAGQLTTTVSVPITNDAYYENNETFYINLSGASAGTIGDSQGIGTITNDDSAPSVTLSLTGSPLAENGGTATVTATLSNRSYQNVTTNLGFTGTATNTSDYTRSNTSITINTGSTTGSITLTGVNDAIDEDNETVIVDITSVTNGTESGTQQVTAAITDDDVPPAISVNDPSVTEGDGGTVNLTYAVSLSAASAKTVTVDYSTSAGTAVVGTDYTSISTTTLTFNPGVTSQNVTVTVLGDLIDEDNETVNLNLVNPTNATILDAQGVGTITDNDPSPGLSINDVTVAEGNTGTTNAVFTVTLSAASERTVTVNYATANNTAVNPADYTAAANTLTFTPGTLTQTITVTVQGDVTDENDETYYVNLSGASNATISDNQGLGTITDDDGPPSVSVNDPSVLEGDAGTVNLVFTITLSAASDKTITVDYATSNGTATTADGDYVSIGTTTLTYTPGQITKTVNVTINGDLTNEPNETVNLNLSNPVNVTISDPQGVGTITNDDGPPVISINDVTITEGNAGTINMTFTVSLNKTSASTITVDYATANNTAAAGTDYTAVTGTTLTYTPGQTTKTVDVVINGDTMDEDNETFYVNLTNEINAVMGDNQGVGTINDNDNPPTISINDITKAEGNSGSSNAVFTVTLSQASGKTITVDYASTNGTAIAGTDYTVVNATMTINPGLASQTINVPVSGDLTDEDDETFTLDLSNPVNATISDAQGIGTITDDDDLPAVTLSVSPANISEALEVSTVTATLSSASSKTVTVTIAASGTASGGGTDYTLSSTTITINAGNTSGTATVTSVQDVSTEGHETVIVDITGVVNGTEDGVQRKTITILDDDLPSVTLSQSVSSFSEASGTNTITAALNVAFSVDVQVVIEANAASSARGGGVDYSISSTVINITAGSLTGEATITAVQDILDEDNETVIIDIISTANAYENGIQQVSSVIIDDDEPEISLMGNNVSIADGDTISSPADNTEFGSTATANGTVTKTFVIKNTGNSILSLTGDSPYITVSGSDADNFTVTSIPSASIPAGDSTTFQVTFDPSTVGFRSAVVSIANDDDDENPFNFSIKGSGLVTVTFTDGSKFTQQIMRGDTNQVLGGFQLKGDEYGAVLRGVSIKLTGSRTGINNLKFWFSPDTTTENLTQLDSTIANDPGIDNFASFEGFEGVIDTDGVYCFITADVALNASGKVQGVIINDDYLTLSGGIIAGIIDNAVLSDGNPLIPTGVVMEGIPKEFSLVQNYPNPFNPTTTINYALPCRSLVRIRIFNTLGQLVSELVNSEQRTGYQSIIWNAKAASGMYFYRIEAADVNNPSKRFVETKKMIFLK